MLFTNISFLLVFLPSLMICYYTIPKKYVAARRYVLMVFSFIFYACGEPVYFFSIAACVALTWILSKGVERSCKLHLFLALAVNLIPLFIFKYLNFVITNLNYLPLIDIPSVSLVLPIGISFYTFQMLTYIIDLYRGKVKRQGNIGYLALYIFLFPQLIAGPIVRYQDVELDIGRCEENWNTIREGVGRFIKGLVKKVIFANQTGMIFDTIFIQASANDTQISVPMMWLAAISYTMQIYFDFSGYSDMAIGLGRMFGFRFLENFNLPYSSLSVTEFWRRWHISMNTFFRDYIYIPLGGSRCSTRRWVFNLLAVWFSTGLWHGAHWNFVLWGLYYAALLIFEKFLFGDFLKKLPNFVGWAYTMFCTVVGWSFFLNDSDSLSEIFKFTGRLFGVGQVVNPVTVRSLELQSCMPYLFIAILLALPTRKLFTKVGDLFLKIPGKATETVYNSAFDIAQLAAFVICIIYIIGGTYNPFIYFRF